VLAATDIADQEIEAECEHLKTLRWQKTAKILAELKPSSNYSAKACKKRFIALWSGTAKIPPELDDDPEGRADAKADRIIAYVQREKEEHQRLFEAAEFQRKEDERMAFERTQRRIEKQDERNAREIKKLERITAMAERKQAKLTKVDEARKAMQKRLDTLKTQESRGDIKAEAKRLEHANFNAAEVAARKAERRERVDKIIAEKKAAGTDNTTSLAVRKRPRASGGRRDKSDLMVYTDDEEEFLAPPARRSKRDAARTASGKIQKDAEENSDVDPNADPEDAAQRFFDELEEQCKLVAPVIVLVTSLIFSHQLLSS
jgi:hypothetical protein